jgi:hypothetical protein
MMLPALQRRAAAVPLATWLVGLACLALAAWAWQHSTESLDDAYITYRYAYNLATGQGFVYNPGERVLGTTTPLYAGLLALAWHVWPDLPALGIFFSGVGWAASVAFAYAIGRQAGSTGAGLIAAGLIAVDPLISQHLGMETHVYLAFCLAAFYCQTRGRGRLAAMLAGAAFLTRWDGILVVGAILLAEWVRTRRVPWPAAAVALAVVLPWLVFSQLYFGSIFPNTFFAKAGQSMTELVGGGANPFVQEGLNVIRQRTARHWAGQLYLPLLLLGLAAAWRWPGRAGAAEVAQPLSRLWPLWLWTVAYAVGYASLNVVGFGWYFVPILPGLALGIGLGTAAIAALLTRWVPGHRRAWATSALLLVLAGLVLWPQARTLPDRRSGGLSRMASYFMASAWLRANTPPGASVAMLEVGVVGYVSERYIVDMMGLVTPSMIGHLANWDQVNYYAIARHWPDYVLTLNSMALNRPTPDDWFGRTYALAATLDNPRDGDAPLRIYQRRAGYPPSAYAVHWPQGLVFDQQFELVNLEAATAVLAPGAEWPVRLSWRVLEDVAADYQFDFELLNLQDGQRWTLLRRGRPFYEGGPTTQWRAGQAYTEQRLLQVPADLPPGHYRLLVRAFIDIDEAVPSRDHSGVSATAMSGPLTTTPAPLPLPPFVEAPVAFADGVQLHGFRVEPGQMLLYWEAASPLTSQMTAFIHVLDEDNQLVAQHDSAPALGQLPTTWWAAGVTVVDPHPLAVPGASFCLGLYDSVSQVRRPVLSADGYSVHDDVACQPWPNP